VPSGIRAGRSVAVLIGFLFVAAAQLALVVLPVLLLLVVLPGSAATRLGLPVCIATVGVMAYATRQALAVRLPERAGIPVDAARAPRLWALVGAAAEKAGVRPPDTVVVVADAIATLTERGRLLGVLPGRRELYLGLPLLLAWDTARIRAVVAHELGHGSPRGSRLTPLAHRGRMAVGRAATRISARNPAGPVLRAYAQVYLRVDAPVSRARELAADRIAAEFAGGAATAAALRDRPALETMLRIFHAEYVGPGWRAGHVPEDLFGGFLRVLAARSDELALLRGRELPPPSKWDTHPPFPERLAALSTSDDAGLAADDDGELVPDLPGLARALQAVAYPPQGRTPVDWDGFFGAARTAEMEREARGALCALSRTGTAVTCVGDLLDLAADGRLSKVAEETFPGLPAEETTARIGELVTLLLALAVLRGGAARWRHSWTGTAELVTPDGGHLDLGALAALATEPATVAAARERLAELGVDPYAAVTGDAARGNAVHGEVVGGLVNLVVGGTRTDLLIVDTGLILVPGLPRAQNGSAKRRLAQFAAADLPVRDVAAPGSRFLPYADLAGATQTRRTPKSWDLNLRDGGTLTVRTALDSDELPGGWAAMDDAVAFLARTR
jgi:Zn-dependent protease with chaperone function